jgi:hypothetical protein
MFAQRPNSSRPARRRGTAAAETLLVLPLFALLLAGMIGLADLLIAEQQLDEASGRAARCAALGGTEEQVRDTIRAVLGPERAKHATIHITPLGCENRPGRSDDRADRQAGTRDDRQDGHADDGHHGRGSPCGLIEVRIELEARYATVTRLAPVRRSEKLVARTVMQRE